LWDIKSNYSLSSGNETRHLRCHFIPRYSSNREFGEIIFKDECWGHNYKTDKSFVIPEELFEGIRQKIKNTLSNKGGFG
jgi:diadenosine tetraphosphate (Ap4A) HIT family hydrolase